MDDAWLMMEMSLSLRIEGNWRVSENVYTSCMHLNREEAEIQVLIFYHCAWIMQTVVFQIPDPCIHTARRFVTSDRPVERLDSTYM